MLKSLSLSRRQALLTLNINTMEKPNITYAESIRFSYSELKYKDRRRIVDGFLELGWTKHREDKWFFVLRRPEHLS